jgi:DNA repair exonuclease SbcCD ATPase subunit
MGINKIGDSDQFNEFQRLDSALQLLHRAEMKVGDIFDGLEEVIKNTKQDIVNLDKQRKDLQKQKEKLQEKARRQQKEISGLTREQMKLLKEYEQVKEELEEFTKVATSVGTINLKDMKATLTIYRILLDEVFASQPHFKILYLLHGDVEKMGVDRLKNATGIGGAMILRACYELANANLIDFDDETHKASLKQRFFPKSEET